MVRGLHEALGWAPLLLRWNTGLPVISSAHALADVLAEVVQEAGPALGRIHLVGHSMGGLLARSVLYVLAEKDPETLSRIDGVWLLATPLEGAPLATRLRPRDDRSPRVPLSDGIRDAGLGFFHAAQHQALAEGYSTGEARYRVPALELPCRLYAVAGSLWPRTGPRPSRERHDGLVDTLSASGGAGETPSALAIAPHHFQEVPLLAHQAIPLSSRVLECLVQWQQRDRAAPVFFSRQTGTAKP